MPYPKQPDLDQLSKLVEDLGHATLKLGKATQAIRNYHSDLLAILFVHLKIPIPPLEDPPNAHTPNLDSS